MLNHRPGDLLAGILDTVQQSVVIVAPFIKRDALEKLLDPVTPDLDLTVISRFKISDIVAGVTDIDIIDVVRSFGNNSRVLICPNLHAKYYRADNAVLVGSANVTMAGLGFARHENLEFLGSPNNEVAGFERLLIEKSKPVTEEILYAIKLAVKEISMHDAETFTPKPLSDFWVPRCKSPENLFQVYRSIGSPDELKQAGILDVVSNSAQADLESLKIKPGLVQKEQFEQHVNQAMLQKLFFIALEKNMTNEVDESTRGIADKEGIRMVEDWPDIVETEAQECWETIKKWLRCFAKSRFSIHTKEERIVAARRL